MPDTNKIDDPPGLSPERIIVVIGPLELGGAERQAIQLARCLMQEQQAIVEVWGCGPPGRATELCDEFGVPWRAAPIPLPWSEKRSEQLKRLARFARALRQARPSVILPFMFLPSVVCGLTWRLTGARLCVWNQRDEGRDRLDAWAERWATRLTPRFVANSGHGAEFLTQTLRVRDERVSVVHNGVMLAAPERDRSDWRAQLEVSDNCLLACMVANLHSFKDHETLLRAWRIAIDRLTRERLEAVLLLAGRFDDKYAALKQLAGDLRLGDTVRFLGPVRDISGLLQAVDLGVHSSTNEGCPNGVLECMAAGLAVVGTDYAGIREAVGPRSYEFLAAPHDAEALAAQIVRFALDPTLRAEAGAANHLRAETEFDPRLMYEKMLPIIASRAGSRTQPARMPDESDANGEDASSAPVRSPRGRLGLSESRAEARKE